MTGRRSPAFAAAYLKLGGAAPLAAAELTRLVIAQSGSDADRLEAIALLGTTGQHARLGLPDLIRMANSLGHSSTGDLAIRPFAAYAVWKIGGLTDEAVHCLIMSVRDTRHDSQLDAIRFLGEIGKAARPAEAALRFAARSEDPRVRQAAVETLKKIGA